MLINPLFQNPNYLREAIAKVTISALKCSALQPIGTESFVVEQAKLKFLIRILTYLEKKETVSIERLPNFNPFLPYDPNLFVCNLSETHLCLLNKFNVLDHHLLIITRQFIDQETWLDQADFESIEWTLAQIDGLIFYNGGKKAGASQHHKHLQLVPFPLGEGFSSTLIDQLLPKELPENEIITLKKLPFKHALIPLRPNLTPNPKQGGEKSFKAYLRLLSAVGVSYEGEKQTQAYNLLMTREWIMIILRSSEKSQGISINALGFAGALLVRNQESFEQLQAQGILNFLTQVGVPVSAQEITNDPETNEGC